MFPEQNEPANLTHLRQQAETVVEEQAMDSSNYSPQELQRLVHELKVHQVELELQNEELRLAQFERETAQKNYAELYHSAPVGYMTLDEDGSILEANLTGAEMLGWKREDLIGQRLSLFVAPEDQDSYHFYQQRLSKTETLLGIEIRLLRTDGSQFYARLYRRSIVRSGEVKVQQYRIVISDISEWVQAEQARQEAHHFISAVLDTASALIVVLDREGRIIQFNWACEQLSGYSFVEAQGQSVWDLLLLPEERAPVRAVFEQLLAGHYPNEFENHWVARDGRHHLISWSNTALLDSKGVVQHVVAIGIDITERKQAEEARAYLATIVNSSDDAIIGKTLEGQVVSWNRGAEQLYGYRAEEMIGHSIIRIFPPERYDELPQLLARIRQGESIKSYETQRITKDGRRLIIALTLSPIKDHAGSLLGASAIARDITVRKQTELELAQLLEAVSEQREQLRTVTGQLAEAQEIERKVLARELHDQVGQKLTALNLNLNTLRTRLTKTLASPNPIMAVLEQSLKIVEETTERVQNVMADLRPPMLDDYGLVAALEWYGAEVAAQMNFAVAVQGQEPEPRLPAPVEHALFRITQEALTNVVKHAQAARVSLSLTEDKGTVRLVITDDGRGFTPSRPNPGERPGWGLLTMAERAEAVGARCAIKSQPGQGSQVIVEMDR